MESIGIGISTYNRPESFIECLFSILKYRPDNSFIVINDDGSNIDYGNAFNIAETLGCTVYQSPHKNIASSKNILLKTMMDMGAYHMFLVEDDMIANSYEAFDSYINAHNETGIHHFLYAHHGSRNHKIAQDDLLTYHYECVGSWCYYTSDVINKIGFMDENFDNCWEHVVHSMLIGDSGLMNDCGWRKWPDVIGSENYIGNIDVDSTHAPVDENELMAQKRIQSGLRYWRDNYRFPIDILPLLQ